jgi:antirestriction protein ArdC
MEFIRNDETRNLNALLKALKKSDAAEINRLRRLTGVNDDYETIKATVRFVEIGAVMTYADAKNIHAGEVEMETETQKARASEKTWLDLIEREKDMAFRSGAGASDLASARRDLEQSEADLKSAQDYRSIWKD